MRLTFPFYDKAIFKISSSTVLHITVINSAYSILKKRGPCTFLQCLLQSCVCNSEVISPMLSKQLVVFATKDSCLH